MEELLASEKASDFDKSCWMLVTDTHDFCKS